MCKPSKLPNVGCAIFRTDRSGALWCEHNIDHSDIPADYVRLEEHNRQLAQVRTDWKAWHRQISDALGCKFLERTVTLKTAQRLRAAIDKLQGTEDHPEHKCQRCGGRNISSWYADNDIWNAVVRKAHKEKYSILCPICFCELAQEVEIAPTAWKLCPEKGEENNDV